MNTNTGSLIRAFLAILMPLLYAAAILRAMYEAALEDPDYRRLKAMMRRQRQIGETQK